MISSRFRDLKGVIFCLSRQQRGLEAALEAFQWTVGIGERVLQILKGVGVVIDIAWRGWWMDAVEVSADVGGATLSSDRH